MKKKIVVALIAVILIAGLICAGARGFNVDAMYANATKINAYIGKDFDKDAVKEIAKEIFTGKEVLVQKVRPFQDVVSITTSGVEEWQIEELTKRLNEQYELSLEKEDIVQTQLPYMELKDMLTQYIVPLAIGFLLAFAYMGVRFRKLGVIKTMGISIGSLVVGEAMLVSLYAITRLPVNMFAISASLAIMGLVFIGSTLYLESKLKKVEKEEKQASKAEQEETSTATE